MKILFVASRFPAPALKGNQVRACQQLQYLCERHDVDLLCLSPRRPSDADFQAVKKWTRRCEVIVPRWRDWMTSAIRGSVSRGPWQSSLYDHPALHRRIAKWRRDGAYDLAHVQLIRMQSVLPALSDLPCVVDLVDALSLNFENRAATERWPLSAMAAMEARRLRAAEREVCEQTDATLVVSARDARHIGGSRAPTAARLAVDLERFPFAPYSGRAGLVFSGNMAYYPNRLAVETLLDEVIPQVWSQRPEERLVVAGANPQPAWARRDPLQRIVTTGRVPDLGAPLRAAAVATFPMRAGSGMQLKILEACASGTPVVTTRLAAEAFDDLDVGEHCLVTDDSTQFAEHTLSLLANPTRAAEMAARARAWVESRYSLAAAGADLERVYAVAHERFRERARVAAGGA